MKSISNTTLLPGLGIAAVAGLAALVALKPVGGMSFDMRVENALLENPEIMIRVFEKLERQQEAEEAAAETGRIAAVADALFAGLDTTKPILVELLDYNCGYCRRAHGTVQALRARHPDLQFVRVETPILGDGSTLAAQAALTVRETMGEAAYDKVSDALMTMAGPANAGTIHELLTDNGFDATAILEQARAGAADGALADAARISRRLGTTGTPVFVGPSGMVRGVGSSEELMQIAAPAQS